MVRDIVRPVDPVSWAHWLLSFGCDVSSLVRNNSVWTTMTVGKAFCLSTDGSLGRSIMYKKGKSIRRISIYFCKAKTLIVHKGRGPV